MNAASRSDSTGRWPAGCLRLTLVPFAVAAFALGGGLLLRPAAASPAGPLPVLRPLAAQTGPMPPRGLLASWRSRYWNVLTGLTPRVRTWTIHYRSYAGARRVALVALPSWYGPHDHPPLPFVISPHGRGITPAGNDRVWGNMPALGRFAVVTPAGQSLYSWGAAGDVADLARMPLIVRRALPWLRIAPHRIYAVGGSMGGQETLLLVAEHPHLLAGAISFDADTNLAARYAAFPQLRRGLALQELLRHEIGGTPATRPDAYRDRSPIDDAAAIAFSRVPLQIWWSTNDRVVVDQAGESGLLYRTIKRLNPDAPVVQYVGGWRHTAEMWPFRRMPIALAAIGLLRLAPAPGNPGSDT